MYKQSFVLLTYFFTLNLHIAGMFTAQEVWQFINHDCYALQDNLQRLPSSELMQRLIVVKEKKYNLDSNAQIIALAAGFATIKIIENPQIINHLYYAGYLDIPLTAATVVGYYLYSRDEVLRSVRAAIEQELVSRTGNQRQYAQINLARLIRHHNVGLPQRQQ